MKRQQKIVLLIVSIMLLSAGVVWGVEKTKQPQLPEGAEPILTYPLDDRDMSLRFFTQRFVDEWSDDLTSQGVGLEITIDDRIESISSISLSEENLMWSTAGQTCENRSECVPYDILYGINQGTTTRVIAELNGERYEPELLKTKAGKDVWLILVDQIESIESITAYDAKGNVSYEFNNKTD
ncbi:MULTISPECIES: hypothetical protein [Exiguobacterium]|uniref:hypothetical protein n=1 Tax=Exiguobacterium TaxID=33986 RepID=UPI001BEA5124|nr:MULTISPECIES: hypothetical protein [Exiguobacterium]MCT4783332.1 hypothetical protein [Exiguobacterium himgiriensis]